MQTDDDSELPNVEDIYDLLTSDLADVEDRLRRKSSNTALTAKEEKLHNLVRVELGERRSVEEIGLALIGGRFDLANVSGRQAGADSGLAKQSELFCSQITSSITRPGLDFARCEISFIIIFQVDFVDEGRVSTAAVLVSLSSQRFPPRLSMAAAQQASPSRPSQAFKPTPVNFDFVIGTSSVKKKAPKRKPKEQKELKECNDPQRKAAPKKREVSGPKATKGLPRPRGRSTNPAAQKQKDEMPAKGYPQSSQVASETAGGEEMKEGEEPDEEDLEEAEEPEELEEPRSRTSVEAPNFVSETFQEVQTRSEGQSAQIAEAQAAAEDMERGDDTENEKGKEQESTDEEAGGDAEVAEDAETAKPLVLAEVPETPEQAGSSTAMSGEHQNPDHEENEDIRSRMHLEGSHDDTGLHAEEQKDKDSPTSSHSSCPSKQSGRGLPPSFVQSKPDESPVCSETESIQPKTAMPYISRDKSRPASASSPSGTVRHELEKTYSLENEALSTTAGHAANVPGPSPRGEAPCKETSSKCEKIQKTRKPPLPHDALRAQAKSITSRANELEYVGLDPKLVETGAIRKYHEVFQNFTDIFSWGRSQEVVPQRERYLRESLQLFSQFCNIIGSLEVQFATKFGPADHSTPNATHQALNAMASRGAGLYGVFLKGIIDKMDADACTVPRPLPVETDVYSLRYYKVVQNRTEVYDIVTRVFHRKDGWEELPHGLGLSNAWNLCWTWSKPKLDYSRLCVWQKVNHFPENKHLTRKDFLKRCIDRYTRTGGKLGQYFNICPKTFVLPKEYCLFIECFTKIAEENGDLEGSLTCHSDYKGIPHDPVAATLATSALEAYEESFGYLVLPDGFGTGSKKPGEAPFGAEGLDGSAGPAGPAGRKFADYRMEAAPKWDGEKPEEQYREYARTLRLWLIEAQERLPESLIGKRILDSIPYGSRLSSVLAHLSVEEITAPDGWKRVVACIEEAHGYLKVAKLEQAFNAAIFGGRRKQVRVLTNGAIDFRLVETAIRKIFNDTLDAVPDGKKSYWWDEYEDEGEDWSEETDVYYGDMPAEPYLFDELMEMDADGEIYLCLEGPLPAILEESEAVEYAGDLSYVYGETADRWQAKSKGKGKKGKGKGKGRGKDPGKGHRGFGVYGTYADYRKALQDARTARGFTSSGWVTGHENAHKDAPTTFGAHATADFASSPRTGNTGGVPRLSLAKPFRLSPCRLELPKFRRNLSQKRCFASRAELPTQLHERAGSDDRDVLFTAEEYVRSAYLTYTYASTSDEPPGCALVDTAAQHGLIGAETLTKLDNHLQRTYKLRVQYTQEEGGTAKQEFFVFRNVRKLAAQRAALERRAELRDPMKKKAEKEMKKSGGTGQAPSTPAMSSMVLPLPLSRRLPLQVPQPVEIGTPDSHEQMGSEDLSERDQMERDL
ncbi:Ttll5 [Symbiodinium sp. KB8]|nr:Ttll5 [Symbiodinium sp. KB8]